MSDIDYDKPGTAPLAKGIFGGALLGFLLAGGGPAGLALGTLGTAIGAGLGLASKQERERRELKGRGRELRERLERDGGWR